MLFSEGGLQYSCDQGFIFSYYSHFYVDTYFAHYNATTLYYPCHYFYCHCNRFHYHTTTTSFTHFPLLVDASILNLSLDSILSWFCLISGHSLMVNLSRILKSLAVEHSVAVVVSMTVVRLVLCQKWKKLHIRGTQRQFLENICSEDDLRSRIFGTFVVKFLACLPLLGFSNI